MATNLATSVPEFPASMQVRSSRHGVTNAGYSNISESQINNDGICGITQFFKLYKHNQHHKVAEQTDHTCMSKDRQKEERKKWGKEGTIKKTIGHIITKSNMM